MMEEELRKFLNWLLQMGIIDAIQYNELYTKCLPYIK